MSGRKKGPKGAKEPKEDDDTRSVRSSGSKRTRDTAATTVTVGEVRLAARREAGLPEGILRQFYKIPHSHKKAFTSDENTLSILFDRIKDIGKGLSPFERWEEFLHYFANATNFWIVRGGDIIHDFKQSIHYEVGGPGVKPTHKSMHNFIEAHAPDSLRTKLERFTHGSDIAIRDEVFPLRKDKFVAKTYSLEDRRRLEELTAELKSAGVEHIYLDAQFGNMFKSGFGNKMNFLFSTASYLDGATKINPETLEGYGIVSKFDYNPFRVPYFTQKENDTVNLTMTFNPDTNVKQIRIEHINETGTTFKSCLLQTTSSFTIEKFKRCVGLSAEDPDDSKPVIIAGESKSYEWRNHEIITMKASTDWSQLIYTLLLNYCGMKTIFVTNDNICLAQAAIMGLPYVIFSRTIGDDEVIDYYNFDENQQSLTPEQVDRIKGILRDYPKHDLIARFNVPFRDALERFNANRKLPGLYQNPGSTKIKSYGRKDTFIPDALINEFYRIVNFNFAEVEEYINFFGSEPEDPAIINRFQSLLLTTPLELITFIFKQKMSEVYKLFKPLAVFYSDVRLKEAAAISNIIHQLNEIYCYKRERIIESEKDKFILNFLNSIYIKYTVVSLHSLRGLTEGFAKFKALVHEIKPNIVKMLLDDKNAKCHDFSSRFEQLLWVFFSPFLTIKGLNLTIMTLYTPVDIVPHPVGPDNALGVSFTGVVPLPPAGRLPVFAPGVTVAPDGAPGVAVAPEGAPGVAGVPEGVAGVPFVPEGVAGGPFVPGVAGGPFVPEGVAGVPFVPEGVAGGPFAPRAPRFALHTLEEEENWSEGSENSNVDKLATHLGKKATLTLEDRKEKARKEALMAARMRQLADKRKAAEAQQVVDMRAERERAERELRERADQAMRERGKAKDALDELLLQVKGLSVYDGRREFTPIPLSLREQSAIRHLPPKSLRRRERPSIHKPYKSRSAAAGKKLSIINKHKYTKKRGITNTIGFRLLAQAQAQALRTEADDLANDLEGLQVGGKRSTLSTSNTRVSPPGTFPLFASDIAYFKHSISALRKTSKGLPFKPSVSSEVEKCLEAKLTSASAIPDYISRVFWALKSDAEESNALTEFYIEGHDLNDVIEQFKKGEISAAALRDQLFFIFFKHPVSSMLLECISRAQLLKLVDLAESLVGEIPSNIREAHAARYRARTRRQADKRQADNAKSKSETRTIRQPLRRKLGKVEKQQYIYTDGTLEN